MIHEFDYAVIGSGLTGLAIATALSQETENIVLLEGQDQIGGLNRSIPFPAGPIENGIRFIPGTESGLASLRFLENLMDTSIIDSIQDIPPVTYEGGAIKTFLSFGEVTPPFFDEMVYFTTPTQIRLKSLPSDWIQHLSKSFRGQVLTRSYATRLQVTGNQAHALTVNGSKVLHAKNYVFCGSVKQLQTLLPPEALAARARHKLSKNVFWTALCLDLAHATIVTENPAIHVLNGTTQDEIGPCLGHFLPGSGEKGQTSQWITFIEDELSEESEVVSNVLKKIKRQIKRAYPSSFENLITERILVAPQMGGNGDLKIKANLTLPEVDNCWIASPTLNSQRNLVGAIGQAQMVLASLGFETNQDEKSIDHPHCV